MIDCFTQVNVQVAALITLPREIKRNLHFLAKNTFRKENSCRCRFLKDKVMVVRRVQFLRMDLLIKREDVQATSKNLFKTCEKAVRVPL